MFTLKQFQTATTQPHILSSYKHILLLSHMRANTSLFGHILGSHEQIEGYYEMHIGYYSWKSLIRQKLIYAETHKVSKKTKYFFDKVLHSEHEIKKEILIRKNVLAIISIRAPEQTIPSIVKLYEKVDPNHDFCTIEGASRYYIQRLHYLKEIATSIPQQFLYLDAESIRENSSATLVFLTDFLKLNPPLVSEYSTQKLTGKGNGGDHSTNLTLGKIKTDKTDYSAYEVPGDLLTQAKNKYIETRQVLLNNAYQYLPR